MRDQLDSDLLLKLYKSVPLISRNQLEQDTSYLQLNRWVATEFHRESLPQEPPSYQKTESVTASNFKVASSEEECPILKFQKSMISELLGKFPQRNDIPDLTNEMANVSKLVEPQNTENFLDQRKSSNEACLTSQTDQEHSVQPIMLPRTPESSAGVPFLLNLPRSNFSETPVLHSVLSSFQPEVFPISEIRNDDSVNPPNQFTADREPILPVTRNSQTPDEHDIGFSLLKKTDGSESLKNPEFPIVSGIFIMFQN